ncbi:MAG: acetylglutamate kinase [Planctomycetota bacterium]|nr:acetylglutamate kinase [Planctomycetota bacterium]
MSERIIIKLGGALLDSPTELGAILNAIATRHATNPGSIIVVHGGGAAIDRQLSALGMEIQKRQGIRVTPPEQMDQVAAVLGGLTNSSLTAALNARGVQAIGLRLLDGGLTKCELFDPALGVGRVGRVVSGDATSVEALLLAGMLPVIAPIGADAQGGLLNINADDAASALGFILGATGLLLLTDVLGVLDPSGSVIPTLDARQIEARLADGTITGGMIPKVRSALAAAIAANAPVTIASWRGASALLAIASGTSVGTAILPHPSLQGVAV